MKPGLYIFCVGTVRVNPKLSEVVAEQLLPADAVIAMPARHIDICCNAVAFLEPIPILANFGDHSRELVPGDHRKFIGRIPAVIDTPVSAADTSVLDLDQNLALSRSLELALL